MSEQFLDWDGKFQNNYTNCYYNLYFYCKHYYKLYWHYLSFYLIDIRSKFRSGFCNMWDRGSVHSILHHHGSVLYYSFILYHVNSMHVMTSFFMAFWLKITKMNHIDFLIPKNRWQKSYLILNIRPVFKLSYLFFKHIETFLFFFFLQKHIPNLCFTMHRSWQLRCKKTWLN